jgi:hypothetical protein
VTASLCLLFLFGGWSADAHDLHACPHHGLPVVAAGTDDAGARQAGSDDQAEHHHGAHGEAHAEAHPEPASGDESHGHGPCTCIGDCSGPPAAELPRSTGPEAREPASFADTEVPQSPVLPTQQLLPYVLPYALAPPPGA